MTFNLIEVSQESAQPIELYKFEKGPVRWYFTSASRDISYGGFTWLSVPIERGNLEATITEERSGMKITVSRSNPVPDLWRVSPPSDVVTVTIYRNHYGDVDAQCVWVGRVLSTEWRGIQAIMACEPASISMNRNGLRRVYQRGCPHKLYGPGCNVDRSLYEVTGAVTAIVGNVVTVSAFSSAANGYFALGPFEWMQPDGSLARRMIVSNTGGALTLSQAIPGLAVGAMVLAAPGCDHVLATCKNKFNNILNYGGMPFIPTKNPHGNAPIY